MKTFEQFLLEQVQEAKEAEDLMDFEANIDRIKDAANEWLTEQRNQYNAKVIQEIFDKLLEEIRG